MTESSTRYDLLWAGAWGDIQRVGPVHRHMQDDLVRVIQRLDVRSILDVGCGSGDSLGRLQVLGSFELTGTDASSRALDIARERASGVRFLTLDIEQHSLPETFDLVMSVQVVEHLVDDLAALRNMVSMSRKYVYVSTMSGRMRRSEVAIGHVRNYTHVELRRKLELAGLDVMWIRGWGFPFYSPLFRSAAERMPGGPPTGTMGRPSEILARALYHLYRLNVPGRGDVVSALARVQM